MIRFPNPTPFWPAVACLALAGCSFTTAAGLNAAAETPAGQLFCAITTVSGPIVVAAIDAEATAAAPAAAPVAIIATGMASQDVAHVCANAGGIAVSPPTNPAAAPKVAVVVPANVS